MKQSQLFTKTLREAPRDEESNNAKLLIRGGFVRKEMAGVYSYLPNGLRVFKKIENIIREEMNQIGAQEILMTTLQDPEVWKKSGRWSDEAIDVWFKTTLANGTEIGIANTHEEALTNTLKQYVESYKDLPLFIYQFQNKFRNELRAKSGIMRTREFVMKDLYSFSRSEEEFREFYERCAEAYLRIFKRVGLGEQTYRTFASGGSFSKFSDEFQTLSDAGEDTIYIDEKKRIAVNKEVYTDEVISELKLNKAELTEAKAIEVGNIFPLSTRFAKALHLTYKDEEGSEHFPIMGSYGIGLGRLMGTVAEVLSDEKGLVWPESVAPFRLHLLAIGENTEVLKKAEEVYQSLSKANIEVLYDDRNISAGGKFSDADLLGIPLRAVVSEKSGDKIEVKKRTEKEASLVDLQELYKI